MTRIKGPLALAAGAALVTSGVLAAEGEKWSYPVEVWDPPFDMASPRATVDYEPLDKAAEKWDLCVSFPHMKDAYWMAVDYGVVDEAKRQGVRLQLVEAGGYTNLNAQISQIEDCVAAGADAVIIGAISLDGLNNLVKEIRIEGRPGDRRDQRHLLARTVGQVPRFIRRNGLQSGRVPRQDRIPRAPIRSRSPGFLARLAPAGSRPATRASRRRSRAARSRSSTPSTAIPARRCSSSWSRTRSRPIPDISYVVGTAVTAEAATGLLRSRGLEEDIKVVSYYFTPGVDQGIRRGQILAAPTRFRGDPGPRVGRPGGAHPRG